MCGIHLVHIASSTTSFFEAARSTIFCASAAFSVNGFSSSTCLPASSASTVLA